MNQQPVIHIHEDDTHWQEAVVSFIFRIITETLETRKYCSISLSGGSTPRQIYEKLAREGAQRGIPWSSIRLFWGDERAVPHTNTDSNFRMVREALLDHIDIPQENVFPFPHPDSHVSSAESYENTLRKIFQEQITFDLSLLGMGDDGHTASIFPHTDLVYEQDAWVKSIYLKDKGVYRISVTAPVINRSGHIAFLVRGASKSKALREVLEGDYNPEEYPAQLIRKSPDVHYFLYSGAGELLR